VQFLSFQLDNMGSLSTRLRQLVEEMKENDRRQQAIIDGLLKDTQEHLDQLDKFLKTH
jgi:hypothetical protein